MPRGTSSVYTATALFFVGLALAAAGLLMLTDHNRAPGFGLIAAGFAVVVGASVLSRRGPSAGGDHPSRGV